uniref:Peroxisomal membrane protein PEX13 n=2 Tax=Plectus sambesii TaxID=2011161 RepID=A0A914XMV4_9BILA
MAANGDNNSFPPTASSSTTANGITNPNAQTSLPPPPLPPRPGPVQQQQLGLYQQPSYGGYGGINSMGYNQYSPYGTTGYGGMYGSTGYGMTGYGSTGYGSYGYGGRMGGYGGGVGGESNFVRVAEESSRSAFQSVESVVMAVSSVANMLDSTLNAVFSSFRAVLGVADQFTRLRAQFTSIFAALALFRWCQRLWRRLLVALRLKPANYASDTELAWTDAKTPTGADWLATQGGPKTGTNWPAIVFWVVAVGGPWLIYKLVSRLVASVEESRKWANGAGEHYEARALYDFQAMGENELPFRAGEMLRVAPKDQQPQIRGWMLGSSADGERIGLLPINHVQIVGRKTTAPPAASLATNDVNASTFEAAFKNVR